MPSREFMRVLSKAVHLYIREMRDGCIECRKIPKDGCCHKHYKKAYDLVLHPGKYIHINQKTLKATNLIEPDQTED